MKHDIGRRFSKKKAFPTAQRITNAEGKRVWLLNGKEYPTMRIMVMSVIEESEKVKKDK